MRIWLDTDIGSDVDDALALAYVLRHPELELVGISTVFGDTELRTRIARVLLEKAGATAVPVISGLGLPLTPGKKGVMFGHEGIGLLSDPEPRLRTTEEDDRDARVDAIAEGLESASPDCVLAIGPLSNLGALADEGVRLPPLSIMGGKFQDVKLPGLAKGLFEWNWFCDPLAVEKVIAAEQDALPRIVPAEVTFRTRLLDGDVDLLAKGDPLARSISLLCEEWMRFQVDHFGAKRGIVALHDPLTAATLVRPELCPFRSLRIEADEIGTQKECAGEANVRIATDVDVDATRDHLMDIWC